MGQGGSAEPVRSPFADPDPAPTASVPPAVDLPSRLTLIPTVLQWSHGGRMVYVTGTFNNWAERIPMRASRNDFTVCLNLPVGTFQYKFIVDNEWRFSPSQPLVQDAQGNVNNCITVLDEEDFMSEPIGSAAADSAFSSDPAAERYGQSSADDAMVLAKDPPPLPIHLTSLVLNSRARVTPPAMTEEFPIPLFCTLLHLCFQHHTSSAQVAPLSETATNTVVVSASHRFRSKFVTLVLYKPTRLRAPAGLADHLPTEPSGSTGRPLLPARGGEYRPSPEGGTQFSQFVGGTAQLAQTAHAPRPPSLMQLDDDGGHCGNPMLM